MRNYLSLSTLVFILPLFLSCASNSPNKKTDSRLSDDSLVDRMHDHIAFLADDAQEGRGIGTEGLERSADYIADKFSEYGLMPLFSDSYTQPFPINWGVAPLPETWIVSNEDTLTLGEDLMPAGFSSDGVISADVVFAGYGITAPEYGYDDYDDLDVEGKILLILEDEPAMNNPDSKFEGTLITQYADLRTKAINAKVHGAAGVLVTKRAVTDDELIDDLPELHTREPFQDVGIPVLFVKNQTVKKLFSRFNLENAQRSINLNESPRSMPISETPIEMKTTLRREAVEVKNIGAMIPGEDEIVVIGAHYDHLGYGQQGSRLPGSNQIHNGADDNASGVALMLELAKYFMNNPVNPTLWFVAFTAEEVGLAGSSWFVDHSPADIADAKFMLNFDMVGRLEGRKISLLGIESAKELRTLAERSVDVGPVEAAMAGGGYGSSDQTSFYIKGIPVLHVLATPHADYHTPEDDVEKINLKGMEWIYKFAMIFIKEIAEPEITLTYQESKAPPTTSPSGRGDRPSLGTIPDFTQPDSIRGVRLQGVRPGTPASDAGLKAGDILVGMDDIVIDNIYDFVFALKSHKPGDEVELWFTRDGMKLNSIAVLKEAGEGHR